MKRYVIINEMREWSACEIILECSLLEGIGCPMLRGVWRNLDGVDGLKRLNDGRDGVSFHDSSRRHFGYTLTDVQHSRGGLTTCEAGTRSHVPPKSEQSLAVANASHNYSRREMIHWMTYTSHCSAVRRSVLFRL